ncbi:MAG TPA: PQQ-dependent sugar dehydrogenase [Verrucomicrobiae bacterium]|nr:PQQ-dependent sugar dehydrogenase [Verrucomicrobiae bacterium]
MKKLMPPGICVFCLSLLVAVSMEAQTLPQIKLEPVFPNLKMPPRPDWLIEGIPSVRPVWMSEAPDGSGRFFIVVQTGRILVVKKGSDGADAKTFLNIEDRSPTFQNEDGLLGMAFHPGFKTNGLVYIYYTLENKPEDIKRLDNGLPVNFPFRSVISEIKVSMSDPDKADMGSERVIFETLQPYWNHKGGELCFGPDGYLYFGLGDGGRGDDPFGNGQNTASFLGKMLRIDVNTRAEMGRGRWARELQYGIPADNPFVKEPDMNGVGAKHEIYAYGFRNPWRWSFDRANGDLWVGDVGQDLWEEVDLVTKGGDYGWNVLEGTHHFKPGPEGARYIAPLMEYPHRPDLLEKSLYPDHTIGLCIVGGYVYRGQKYPSLQGVYIYGDYNLGTIWGFRYDRDAQKITTQSAMLMQPKNICSFAEDLDGELYSLMDDGHIYQLTAP